MNIRHMPVFGRATVKRQYHITKSTTCAFREFVFVNLVDVVHHEGNEIVLDRSVSGGDRVTFPLPAEIVQSLVALLK